ncbi:MAG: hypothetical protein LC099_02850 [Anaerolineales bacterium]|nr:hypothetical protein [Anaerolineales bacterium]
MKGSTAPLRRWLCAALTLIFVGQACALSLFDWSPFQNADSPTATPAIATNTPYAATQTTFVATLPEALQAGEALLLSVVDETTGIRFNEIKYPMTARDTLTYSVALPVPINSVLKYRYERVGGAGATESAADGSPIRYRLYSAASSAEVRDVVAAWSDRRSPRPTGTILGQIHNADSGAPLPNILVTAGGVQFITDSLGRFELTGLPVGAHQLVAYSMDGLYAPFQQGAVVAENAPTIVNLKVKPARIVNVTFTVAVPEDTLPGAPVRIAGNLLQLGDTFADLKGGVSVVSERMPLMNLQADGRYSVTLGLPVGTFVQYKYTLGDGFWNAEHKPDGGWILRDFLVPDHDVSIQDAVLSWMATKQSGAITFEVVAPANTPPGDIVYIQFNAAGWMEPLPMWSAGNNRWLYKLYSPLNFLGAFSYRYCRNAQCGGADDNQTAGVTPVSGRTATTSYFSQDIHDSISSWKWYENPQSSTLVGVAVAPRQAGFVAGVEFQPTYQPNDSYFMPQAFANVKSIGSNLVVLDPTWTVSNAAPLRFSTRPGADPLWIDTAIMVSQARALALNVALFPTPRFIDSNFWQNAPQDSDWQQTFFARYRAFVENYADLAAQSGAQFLILGGEGIAPALPNGTLPDGSPSNFVDAEAQWRSIIQDAKSRFKGQVLWAQPYAASPLETPTNILREADGVYLLWSAPLATDSSATKSDYAAEAGRLLDNEVSPLASLLNKPVVLAFSYPSATGAANGCVLDGGACLRFDSLSRPNDDVPSVGLNLQQQADIYEALLNAVNARSWIAGFVSRGYYPPALLQDKSTSVHGKPAADLLWYWYPRFLGKQ